MVWPSASLASPYRYNSKCIAENFQQKLRITEAVLFLPDRQHLLFQYSVTLPYITLGYTAVFL